MFTKLLKYEFTSVCKVLFLLSIFALVIAILFSCFLFILNPDSEILPIDYETDIGDALFFFQLMGFLLLLLVTVFVPYGYLLGVNILLFYRFYKHKFTDQGYLTFTLPASTHQVLLSSIVNILIWSVISFVVFFIGMGALSLSLTLPSILSLDSYTGDVLSYYFQDLFWAELEYRLPQILTYPLTLAAGGLYNVMLPVLSICIGALIAKKHKVLAAIGVGIGISLVISALSGTLSIGVSLGVLLMSSSFEIWELANLVTSLLTSVCLIAFSGASYFLCHYIVKNKLNI